MSKNSFIQTCALKKMPYETIVWNMEFRKSKYRSDAKTAVVAKLKIKNFHSTVVIAGFQRLIVDEDHSPGGYICTIKMHGRRIRSQCMYKPMGCISIQVTLPFSGIEGMDKIH